MECSLQSIHLYSGQQDTLVHFLSGLFDMDVRAGEQESYLTGEGLSFCVHASSLGLQLDEGNMAIELSVESETDLNNLRQKIEFIHYRDSDHSSLRLSSLGDRLEFYDVDNRRWIISVRH